MIGGTVDRVFQFEDRLSILVRGHGMESGQEVVVEVVREVPPIKHGDDIWWQDDTVYWSPQRSPGLDLPLPRVGYSYAPLALWPKVAKLCREGICPVCSFDGCLKDGEGSLWCPRCDASYQFSDMS